MSTPTMTPFQPGTPEFCGTVEMLCEQITRAKGVASARGHFITNVRSIPEMATVLDVCPSAAAMAVDALCCAAWGAEVSDAVIERWQNRAMGELGAYCED